MFLKRILTHDRGPFNSAALCLHPVATPVTPLKNGVQNDWEGRLNNFFAYELKSFRIEVYPDKIGNQASR